MLQALGQASLAWAIAGLLALQAFVPVAVAQTKLPQPEPDFNGKIGITYQTSEPDTNLLEPWEAPASAPNVLLVLTDDAGFGSASTFGGAIAWFGKNHNMPDWESRMAGPFDRWPRGLGYDDFYGFVGGDTDQFHPALVKTPPALSRRKPMPMVPLITSALTWRITLSTTFGKKRRCLPKNHSLSIYLPGPPTPPTKLPESGLISSRASSIWAGTNTASIGAG